MRLPRLLVVVSLPVPFSTCTLTPLKSTLVRGELLVAPWPATVSVLPSPLRLKAATASNRLCSVLMVASSAVCLLCSVPMVVSSVANLLCRLLIAVSSVANLLCRLLIAVSSAVCLLCRLLTVACSAARSACEALGGRAIGASLGQLPEAAEYTCPLLFAQSCTGEAASAVCTQSARPRPRPSPRPPTNRS